MLLRLMGFDMGNVGCVRPGYESSPVFEPVTYFEAPSGDQEGSTSRAGSSVRLTGFEPSASITYISALRSRSDTKAILPPSGDQSVAEALSQLFTGVAVHLSPPARAAT